MPSKILSGNAEHMEPVGHHMGYHSDLSKSSRNQLTSRAAKDKIQVPRASRSLKLQDKLKSEKPISKSYADLHHKSKQNVGNGPFFPPKSSGDHYKQSVERKSTKDDELVKHMLNLPRYLQHVERGENLQEKALNFGVLDWGHLEKWKYNQKQAPGRNGVYSPSTSNTSSPFSRVRSSTMSSRSDSGTLAQQRKQSPSLSSHLNSSSKEFHSLGVKSYRGNAAAVQDFKTVPNNASVRQQKLPRIDKSCRRNYSEITHEKHKGKDSDPKIVSVMGPSSSILKDYEVSFCPKGKMKALEGESTQKAMQFQEFKLPDQHCVGRHKTIILLLPSYPTRKSFSGVSQQSDSAMLNDGRPIEANHKSFRDSLCINQEVQLEKFYSDIPHSCPLPCRVESSKQPDMKLCSSVDAQGSKVPSDVSHSLACSDEIPTIQSKDKPAKENKSIIKPTNPIFIKPSNGSGPKAVEAVTTKGRNPSPNNRSSVGLGRMRRSFSFKEGPDVPQLNSTHVTAKSGPVGSDACADISSRDKANANSRDRSSPLRRLLDPLLRPKSANRISSAEALQDESTSMHRTCKSSDGQVDSSAVQPVKRNLNFSSCRPSDADDSHQGEKQVESMVQALLQVTVRNGLPWFTFAVDNNSNILAATMKKISTSGKYDCSWIYTFYSFSKHKKKSGGWINQGSKGKSLDYVPNVVGKMKVSGPQCPKLSTHNSKDQFSVREFVLFGIEPKQADPESLVFQPNSELVAIVVKVPKETMGNLASDGQQRDHNKDLSEMRLPGCLPEDRCSCNMVENLQSGPNVVGQSISSATVILPTGVHGLPSLPASGVPSSLIHRWKSGGSCDCGGWDVGCQLRVLSNQDECSKNLCSSKACCSSDQFDLFVQGGRAQENKPVLSLTTFQKGIYSIDFIESISSLQAFSICTAFLHSRKLVELSEVSNLVEDITSKGPISMETERIRVPTRVVGKASPSYIPFPPLSPVGRA